ncbi:hypothetical protein C8J57DRAFT_1619526 [Mycena rebaudengoi]|nr:hypothetical protein C8J57DRAFT_1619526 [Mycena rebaudengoi]
MAARTDRDRRTTEERRARGDGGHKRRAGRRHASTCPQPRLRPRPRPRLHAGERTNRQSRIRDTSAPHPRYRCAAKKHAQGMPAQPQGVTTRATLAGGARSRPGNGRRGDAVTGGEEDASGPSKVCLGERQRGQPACTVPAGSKKRAERRVHQRWREEPIGDRVHVSSSPHPRAKPGAGEEGRARVWGAASSPRRSLRVVKPEVRCRGAVEERRELRKACRARVKVCVLVGESSKRVAVGNGIRGAGHSRVGVPPKRERNARSCSCSAHRTAAQRTLDKERKERLALCAARVVTDGRGKRRNTYMMSRTRDPGLQPSASRKEL